MRAIMLILTAFTLCISNIAQSQDISSTAKVSTLSTFDNTYTAKLYGFHITARSTLTAQKIDSPEKNNAYIFTFNAESIIGDVKESTEFEWNVQQQQTIPKRYFYKRNGIGKDRNDQLVFDWDKLIISNKIRNIDTPLDATKHIQDSLSYQIQLRQDLIAGKKNMSYNISNREKIRQYQFDVVGEEVLDTPLGKVNAIKVKRQHDNNNVETIAWFAKDFQYLLVRLQKEENGSAYTIYLSKASLDGKAIEHF